MKLVTYASNGQPRIGLAFAGHVADLSKAANLFGISGKQPASVLEFLEQGDTARQAVESVWKLCSDSKRVSELSSAGVLTAEKDVDFLPPIPNPNKIICLGQNYRAHVKEMGHEVPKYPTLFAKFSNTLIGHRKSFVMPTVSKNVDYEAELAVIIGRKAKNVPAEKALDYIGGYSPLNDISIRDYQRRTQQWLQGKTFDGAAPMGPALVTPDEVGDSAILDISLRLNGTIMQQANTRDLIFDIPMVINYITQFMTLLPGDIISTGTPSGVGAARDPQVFMKAGDKVQVEIAKLGVLETSIVAS